MNKLLISFIALSAITLHAAVPSFSFTADKKGIDVIPNMVKDMGLKVMPNNDREFTQSLLTLEEQQFRFATPLMLSDPYDTHIHNNLNDLHLGFSFKPLVSPTTKTLGYAAIGTYVEKDGWSGVKQFFKSETLGMCEYSQLHLKYVAIDAAGVTHEVNGKTTVTYEGGNDKDGFLYTVTWLEETADQTVMKHEIDCANWHNNPTILNSMLTMAKAL